MAPNPMASTIAESPMAPSARPCGTPSGDSCRGGAAGAVNHRPGRPATCMPAAAPLPPAPTTRLAPSTSDAALNMQRAEAIQRLRKKLGLSPMKAAAFPAPALPVSLGARRPASAAVAAGVLP